MTRLCRVSVLSIVLCISLLVCDSRLGVDVVYAESSETLLNVYGMTLGGPDKLEIEDEIASIQNDINNAETAKTFVEADNAFTKYHENINNEKLNSLSLSLNSVLKNNNSIVSDISDNLMTMEITTLLSKDKEYKNNVSKANNIISDMDIINGISYSYSTFDYDFDGMQDLLSTKRVLYAEALDTYELGDVTNVRFPMDIERYVTSKYGNRIDPLNKSVTSFHAGTDYRASTGTKVYSLFNGIVSSCGWSNTSGYYVVVESGENVKTFYCHLSEILVTKGQELNQYDLIALSGGTGSRSTGPHLHLALYLNGSTYDVDRLFNN